VTWNVVLVFVHLLAACVWVGGFVAIAVVARVARRELEAVAPRGVLSLARQSYGKSGRLRAYGRRPQWDGPAWPARLGSGGRRCRLLALGLGLGLALIIATVAGIVQARRMTRLRHQAVIEPRDPRMLALIDRGARQALILRASIGTLTLALLGLGVVLAA
jgi:hypothetical protein